MRGMEPGKRLEHQQRDDTGDAGRAFVREVVLALVGPDQWLAVLGIGAVASCAWAGHQLGLRVGYPNLLGAIGLWAPVALLVSVLWRNRSRRASAGGVRPITALGIVGVGLVAVAGAGVAGAEWYGAAGALVIVVAVTWGLVRLIGFPEKM